MHFHNITYNTTNIAYRTMNIKIQGKSLLGHPKLRYFDNIKIILKHNYCLVIKIGLTLLISSKELI